MIGIVVGVAAVIAVVTIIKGLDQTVASTFSSQGSTVFTISKRPQIITSREEFIKFNKRKDVTHEDAEAIGVFARRAGAWACRERGRDRSSTAIRNPTNVRMRGVTLSMFDIEALRHRCRPHLDG